VADALKDDICKLGDFQGKTSVIHNGVDLNKFKRIEKTEARRALNQSSDKQILISAGRLNKNKNYELLIKAVNACRSERKDVQLAILGPVDISEYDHKTRLIDLCKTQGLKVGEDVIIKEDVVHNELHKWLSAADVFCLTSHREGWPTVFFEAMACGLPIVSTKVQGTVEAIKSEDYGILVEHDVNSVKEGIMKALEKEWDTEKIISYAKENTWDILCRQFYEEIKKVV
jgi:glycosyltransferase involved in cell wall biosynthesis